MIGCIWIVALGSTIPWALFFQLVPLYQDSDVNLCIEVWPPGLDGTLYFLVANVFACYLVPMSLISLCYVLIWIKVSKRSIPGDSKDAQMDRMQQKSKIKVVKMLIAVVILFVLSWLPLYLIFARIKFGNPEMTSTEEEFLQIVTPIAQWLGSSNSCINPCLYAFFNKKYRRGFAAIIRSRSCCTRLRYVLHMSSKPFHFIYAHSLTHRFINISDTMRMLPLRHRRPAPASHRIITTRKPNTAHQLSPMQSHTFTIRIQIKSIMCWASKTVIYRVRCFWNRTVTVRVRCCSNRRASAVYRVRIAMLHGSYCWNKTATDPETCYRNRIHKSLTLKRARDIWCGRTRICRSGQNCCTNRTAQFPTSNRERARCASRTPKYRTLKARRILCAARTASFRSSNTSGISWSNKIQLYHSPNSRNPRVSQP